MIDSVNLSYFVPEKTRETIENYIQKGWHPGSFVKSVLANDLVGAILKADDNNLMSIKEIVEYVYWCVPSDVWGSYEEVNKHLNKFERKENEN